MLSFFKKIFGNYDFGPMIAEINSYEAKLRNLTLEELRTYSSGLKNQVRTGAALDSVLAEAFALIRETSRRTLGQRHFDVQLMGGIALHQGKIVEMLTGEGKTLAATAPAYLNALTGRGVHVITVNDYLARRDTVWMGQIYRALGLSVGCLTHESAYLYDPAYVQENPKSEILNPKLQIPNEKDKERDILGGFKVVQDFLRPVSRKEAYLAHITYGTNHEFGFDYLRDNLAYSLDQQVQARDGKVMNFAIIDEVDSILIDEARTPLIIAAPDTESSEFYKIMSRAVARLEPEVDYTVDEKLKHVSILEGGIDKIEKMFNIKNIYAPENFRLVHYLEESLKAKSLFHRDKNYVVKPARNALHSDAGGNNEVIIVDEFTGRLMHGRRYSGGLHQAIEAKEGVKVMQESRTFAQITIQNYFRLYEKVAGMTGTAQTSAEEFDKVYKLEVVSIPSNKPMIRKNLPDLIYKNTEAKFRALIEEVKNRHLEGQPVLIGTASIEGNEFMSAMLGKAGIPHEILNAKNHEREGAIIAQAGRLAAVTVATNMAGRGVDIILGGNPPDSEEAEKIKELGGLHVIGTDRHEARRIDNQLRGRSGRQGDPGSSQFFLSLEDDLLRIFGGEKIKSLMETFNLPEDQPIESQLVTKVVNEAQKKVEGFNFDARKHLLEYDDVLNKQRTAVYKKRQELLKKGASPEVLSMLDILWMNYLEELEALRESVGMRAYGQHEPLVEYRRESYILYKEMMARFDSWLQEWSQAQINADRTQKNAEIKINKQEVFPRQSAFSQLNSAPNFTADKIGRNDPCPCGAKHPDGRPMKYKKCHGKNV
ncbi:preprotein translocase subunit SecA [Candidatus Wolfebacteria bacterium]|nr:preprotein translocase subunit SecA [Candidatus Wolfebacteria bacterium]